MSKPVTWIRSFCLVLVILAGAHRPAHASFLFELGAGLKVGPNVSLLSEPSEETINLPVPGFAGVAWGIGLSLEALYLDIVGIEINLIYAQTSGTGEVTINNVVDVEQNLTSSELQIPVMLHVQVPGLVAKPFLNGGITFVSQLDSEYTLDQSRIQNPIDTTIEPESYSMWTLGLGVLIDLGVVRIPIEARGMYQSLDDDPNERVDYTVTGPYNELIELGVRSRWEAQFWLLTGVQYSLSL